MRSATRSSRARLPQTTEEKLFFLRLGFRRGRDGEGHGLGVDDFDLVAFFYDLEVIGVAHLQLDDVAGRTL